jgi:SAM-dependent methyltransferase
MQRNQIRRVTHSIMNRGFKGFCALALLRASQRLGILNANQSQVAAERGQAGAAIHPFDIEYGTDTSGLVWGEFLSSGHSSDFWSNGYYGVSPSLLTNALSALAIDYQRFTFIDIGSGKGRALLLASRFPFRKIIGVELIPELSAAAGRNIDIFNAPWQTCHEIEAITADATEFSYPAGPLVVYLYSPCLPPHLKRCVQRLSRVLAHSPRETYLIYAAPDFSSVVQKYAPGFEFQWERSFGYTPEEATADKLGRREERVALWRYSA